MGTKFSREIYRDTEVVVLAQRLLGCHLFADDGTHKTAGIIVETEAYRMADDRACHAFGGRRTKRNATMFGAPGHAYVYLCYGIHHLFNVVAQSGGQANAVLIRAIEPTVGIERMLARRNASKCTPGLTAGPGRFTQALGISVADDGTDLLGNRVWIEAAPPLAAQKIEAGPRVGVAYAGADALLPWRFWVKGNRFVSKARPRYTEIDAET